MSGAEERDAQERPRGRFTRRALLLGGGVALGAAGAAVPLLGRVAEPAPAPSASASARVLAAGAHQAGVAEPAAPQQHCLLAVGDLDRGALQASLAALGELVLALTGDEPDPALLPDGAGDLTVTIGVGPEALAATPAAPTVLALAEFAGDAALPAERRGGDLLLSVNAADPSVLDGVLARLTEVVAGWRERWSEAGTRPGSTPDGIARNPLGYHDGVIVPRGEEELAANVWIGEGALAGGTVCVLRRFRLDTAGFRALGQDARDAVIGRRQQDGAPLSGGELRDEVALRAKREDGELLVPQRAHARAAHPSFTGSELMLRRSYGYRASADDHGLLFISHQRDVETFNRTQLRLDETDALMDFATPTATAAFAILPGFDAQRPLGATLFD